MPTKVTVTKPTTVRIKRLKRPIVHYIKEWRKFRELSLEALGAMADVSPSMISQLETGKTTYTQITLEKLAKALEVEPWQLLVCSDPAANAELWRILATLEHSDMKVVLRQFAERRHLGDGKTLSSKGAGF